MLLIGGSRLLARQGDLAYGASDLHRAQDCGDGQRRAAPLMGRPTFPKNGCTSVINPGVSLHSLALGNVHLNIKVEGHHIKIGGELAMHFFQGIAVGVVDGIIILAGVLSEVNEPAWLRRGHAPWASGTRFREY